MDLNGAKETAHLKAGNSTMHETLSNPLRDDAFFKSDALKIERIAGKFREIIEIIGLDLSDDSLQDTPHRIAKMYVNEIFKGLNPKNKPEITVFKNTYNYHEPLIELNIPFTSFCEHHFVPIQGKANIAYFPSDYVIGLSKIHRIVNYLAQRPQVQERLTQQIAFELESVVMTPDVGVVLNASHCCISCRGVEHLGSTTRTSAFRGQFKNNSSLKMLLQ